MRKNLGGDRHEDSAENDCFHIKCSTAADGGDCESGLPGARLVIMDEPTSTLTEGETRKLFQVISSLKQRGITIIYISHRMDEIFEICDSYTILRDGTFHQLG